MFIFPMVSGRSKLFSGVVACHGRLDRAERAKAKHG
jgi:hypothetical protein